LGTDERAVIDILCSRDAKEINELKEAYQRCNLENLTSKIKIYSTIFFSIPERFRK
jgi:hypothetical protein